MGSKGPQPIMDQQESVTKELTAEQWNFAHGRLQPSMAAMDKLEKEGLKMVQIVGRDKKRDPLFVKLSLGCILSCNVFFGTSYLSSIHFGLQESKSLC